MPAERIIRKKMDLDQMNNEGISLLFNMFSVKRKVNAQLTLHETGKKVSY